MTKEYALKQLKGLPLDMRDAAKKDIDLRAYKTVEMCQTVRNTEGKCRRAYPEAAGCPGKFKLPDGKELYGRAANLSVFGEMHDIAARGEPFTVTYLENSGVILEIEETNP